jgi:EH_Signature domain
MIDQLRSQLSAAMTCRITPELLACPEMTRALGAVRRNYRNPVPSPPPDSIMAVVTVFMRTREVASFEKLRLVCYGVGMVVSYNQKSILNDNHLLAYLFDLTRNVQGAQGSFQFIICYQGLLSCYLNHQNSVVNDPAGLFDLRIFLDQQLDSFHDMPYQYIWLATLQENRQLLTDSPCQGFAKALAKGETTEFEVVCEKLGVSTESWIREEAVVAQVNASCEYSDETFKSNINKLITLFTSSNIRLSDRLKVKCLAMILIRYSACHSHPEHKALRDAAVERIGNPWLKKPSWDAMVGNESARRMVDGWLKRQLIHDFFALLSVEGDTDRRRLNYWLRYADMIDDLWLVLGKEARENNSTAFRNIRKIASGRLVDLEHATRRNNAFIMVLNDKIIVEFGETGNACYVFNANNLPFSLDSSALRCDRFGLKCETYGQDRLLHKDNSHGTWEEQFDNWLRPRVGWDSSAFSQTPNKPRLTVQSHLQQELPLVVPRPQEVLQENPPVALSRPQQVPQREPPLAEMREFVERHGLLLNNSRFTGGYLWIECSYDRGEMFYNRMTQWGFIFHAGRGWWKK